MLAVSLLAVSLTLPPLPAPRRQVIFGTPMYDGFDDSSTFLR